MAEIRAIQQPLRACFASQPSQAKLDFQSFSEHYRVKKSCSLELADFLRPDRRCKGVGLLHLPELSVSRTVIGNCLLRKDKISIFFTPAVSTPLRISTPILHFEILYFFFASLHQISPIIFVYFKCNVCVDKPAFVHYL
uniref:Uncharacterized protein n=1 Tax=Sphaerodactylus townsendi TaxID=933632 RepID=A0ACB8F0S0_9SAUR